MYSTVLVIRIPYHVTVRYVVCNIMLDSHLVSSLLRITVLVYIYRSSMHENMLLFCTHSTPSKAHLVPVRRAKTLEHNILTYYLLVRT